MVGDNSWAFGDLAALSLFGKGGAKHSPRKKKGLDLVLDWI